MKIIKLILLLFLPIQIICQENTLYYNNIYRQAEIIIGDDGVRYSTVIRIGFNQKVVNSPLYNNELKVEDIINFEMREIFNAIKKKYGEYKIKKSFSGSIPNDTIKFSSLLKKNVKQNDYSQKITLKFLSPVPIDSIINFLNRQKYVQYAVGPYEYRLTGEPDDTYFQISRWAFEKTQLIQSWDITKSNPNINIAIVDAFENFFITSLHSELQNKIDLPFYWTNTFGGHGLAIAGVAGAITNNSSGVSSSGWDSKILFERAWQWENLDWPGPPQGIRNAINRGAHIINCSFVTGPDPELMSAVQDAIRAGVVVVASAGNDYGFPIPSVLYPAAYNFGSEGQVIAVSATICYDGLNETKVNSFNYSPGTDPVNDPTNSFIDFAAPGGNYSILSPSYYNDFVHYVSPGTSLATAFTSGIISLLKAINPNLTPTQVYNILKHTTDKIGTQQYYQQSDGYTWNQYMGYGRINAYKALKYTLENYGGTLTQTLTIPSGETWNFQPGVTVRFANGASLIINGILNAVGNSTNRITFTRSGASGTWGGVVVNSKRMHISHIAILITRLPVLVLTITVTGQWLQTAR